MRKITEKEALELANNNYIKIVVEDVKSQKKFDRFLELMLSASKNNYKIEVIEASEILDKIDMSKMEATVTQDSNPIDVVNAYTAEIDLGNEIDSTKLQECMETLYKEVLLAEKEGN